jgi:hypothetical protein
LLGNHFNLNSQKLIDVEITNEVGSIADVLAVEKSAKVVSLYTNKTKEVKLALVA